MTALLEENILTFQSYNIMYFIAHNMNTTFALIETLTTDFIQIISLFLL
jgi:hypothetical protein